MQTRRGGSLSAIGGACGGLDGVAQKSDAGGMAEGMAGKSFQGASHPVTVPTIPGAGGPFEAGVITYIARLREANFLESFQPLDCACEMISTSYVAFNQAENPIAA